jgi:hypothetical protein
VSEVRPTRRDYLVSAAWVTGVLALLVGGGWGFDWLITSGWEPPPWVVLAVLGGIGLTLLWAIVAGFAWAMASDRAGLHEQDRDVTR